MSFKKGDTVVLICDDKIKYTILSLYGNNNANAICEYYDIGIQKHRELSVPVVALKKYKKTAGTKHIRPGSPLYLKEMPAKYL